MSEVNEKMRSEIEALAPRYPSRQALTLPALHIVQQERRCISRQAVEEIAEILRLLPAEVDDTLSFYGFFRHEEQPLGRHRVQVCRSLSCMLRGGEELLAELCSRLGVKPGETTADGRFTVEFAECLGVCEGAPCVLVDDECYPDMTADTTIRLLDRTAEAGGSHAGV